MKILLKPILFITLLVGLAFGGQVITDKYYGNVGGGNNTVTPLPVRNFLGLTDTPNSYTGQGSKIVSVKADESGLEFTTGGGGTVGPGTVNEIAYFDTTTSIASLTTATYPSLTQLSYVKGVTSAIQTQLDAKVPSTRTLTINGSAQDLSANRSWTVGDALVANPLSQFAATTSLQLKGVISDETGSGALVFATSPTFVTPTLGAASATSIDASSYVRAPYIYGGDMSTTYPSYTGGVFGSTTGGGFADFVHANARIGEFYTTSSAFNFFSDVGKSINFFSNADYGGAPAIGIDTAHQIIMSSLDTGITAPTTSGTIKMVITDSNGQLSFDDIPTGGGITIGTTTITSGANTKVLYNNSGVVGEYTVSGSGNVAMTSSPVFTTPNIGSATGSVSGNAGTATALQNARTIGGVSFDGTANITVATATGGFTISGGNLALGTNSITMTGSLGTTGARLTKGWFTDLEVTNAIVGSITGNAATATALAANGTNCSAGDAPRGVDASGNAENCTTYLTGNQTITLSGDVSGSGTTAITTTIGNDKILESMLKAVDTPTDEECLTYEGTVGDFEWQSCGGGGGSPGGSDTQFQYNNASSFGGVANLTFNNTSGAITFAGSTDTTQLIFKANATQGITSPFFKFQDSSGNELARMHFRNDNAVAIGYQAADALNSGAGVYIGRNAGGAATNSENVAIGNGALAATTGNGENTVVGSSAGNTATGMGNTLIGANAGGNFTSADNNVAIGAGTLTGSNGAGNTAIGQAALEATSGSRNVALGQKAGGDVSSGTYNIAIGSYSTPTSNTGSGQLNIGNVIYGTSMYQTASTSATPTANGTISIGIAAAASSRLTLAGSTTAISSMRITSGTAPSSPVDGDVWQDGTHLYAYIGGGTRQLDQQAGGASFTWTEVTTTSQSAAVNSGYIANNAGLVTITIPTTCAVGDTVQVAGVGAGGWAIAQNASEIIHFSSSDTTTGVTGSLASTHRRDSVELLCVVANTEWNVIKSIGNITIN